MIRPRSAGPVALSLVLVASAAWAADPPPLTSDAAKAGYALGYKLGQDMKGVDVQGESLLQGLKDGQAGAPPKLSEQEMNTSVAALQKRINEQREKAQAAELQKTAAAGSAFLAENGKKPGVTTTASGLQYKVLTPGAGRKPTASDTVTVNYRGTLVDGTEFDSSYKRGQPATFPVNGVIAGWTEALQLMQEGAKWQVAIPPSLAYADRGPLANQVLLFDIELLSVGAAAAQK
jgi:FKBP-type peptidyl-prolyl cis-trans isomerase FklB